MITFFACPKPFRGHAGIIQRNAIKSWALLKPKPEIILLGKGAGVAEISRDLGLIHIPEVNENEFGTPLVDSIFRIGQSRASHPVVCYVNSDIILMSDFMRAVEIISARMPKFLMLGRRRDVAIAEAWDFDAAHWEKNLKNLAVRTGRLHEPNGIDFFCFPRNLYTDIPPFAVGRFAWDNWLVWRARAEGASLVDVTETVVPVHQDHGYEPGTIRKLDAGRFITEGRPDPSGTKQAADGRSVELGLEVRRNMSLVPGDKNLNILASTWMLNKKGRVVRRWRKPTPSYLLYRLRGTAPFSWPCLGRIIRRLSSVRAVFIR